MAPPPSTSGSTRPISMAHRSNATPLAEVENWPREVRLSQGSTAHANKKRPGGGSACADGSVLRLTS
ncbi:regulatory protein, alpa family [Anopheles sinensis]|uniref:Regulatory protein, alpa family n=1 Tax=Anopheles sinensis TaxID=74873 RepID=A0A084VUH7_ANOSI|nr:regulatory protein, alpa family [Anopheles sinensis]